MAYRIQVHVQGDDPVVLDVEDLPQPGDQLVMGVNPQRRDGKPITYLNDDVNQVIFPVWRINFIQILPSEGDEEIPTFVLE
jgi:hypothetical protein